MLKFIWKKLAQAALLGMVAAAGNTYAEIVVGAVQPVAEHEWYRTVEAGMSAVAKKNNVKLIVTNSRGRVDTEAQSIDDMITRGVNAIIVAPLDTKASIAAVQRAVNAGIKFIDYDSTLNSPLMNTFVGVDNRELGAQMGRYVVDYVKKNLGGKANIAMLIQVKFEISKQRSDGFRDEIKKAPGIKIVAEQEGDFPEKAANNLETILQGNPNLQLVWASNEGGLVGAQMARASRKADIKIFGTDMSLQNGSALLDPNSGVVAISTQDPFGIGEKAMELAIAASKGTTVAGSYTVPLAMYTTANLDAVKAYIETYKSIVKK